MRAQPTLLRACILAPVSRSPIRDGGLIIERGRIAAIGKWRDISRLASGKIYDLGDVAVLPGLINAHCHLDYTHMCGQFLPPRVFSDWLKLITSTKSEWTYSDYAASWLEGAQMLERTGTTTVADIEAVPELLPELWQKTNLRVLSFLELIGITGRRSPTDIVGEAIGRIRGLGSARCSAGLSPHSPYSTTPELMRLSAEKAGKGRLLLCTHVSESSDEFEMFSKGKGEMYSWLARSSRDMSDCGLGSPIKHLSRCGLLGKNLLAVHVNYLAQGDVALLARNKVSVIHCPRSHAYFRHGPFPLSKLTKAGVNVCLGTDSLASVFRPRGQDVELNMFEEMCALRSSFPGVAPKQIIQMATVNAARALGMQGKIGKLAKGAFADLIAIPVTGKTGDVYDAALNHTGPLAGVMIDGKWVVAPAPRARRLTYEQV